jgi:hypothetical protein
MQLTLVSLGNRRIFSSAYLQNIGNKSQLHSRVVIYFWPIESDAHALVFSELKGICFSSTCH